MTRLPSLRRIRPVLAAAFVACGGASAGQVGELKPDQLASYRAQNKLVVVQLTSPDPKCRYCVGADKTFDQAAAQAKNPALKFARVQWPVWHKMPSLEPLLGASGVPRQIVFRDGHEMRSAGGRPENAAGLLDDIDAILALPAAPGSYYDAAQQAAPEPAPAPPHVPLTSTQQVLTRLMIRRDFFAAVTGACGRLFPAQAEQYKKALDAWQVPRKDQLNQASRLMLMRSSREDAAETTALTGVEKTLLQSWQVEQLGVPMTRKPELKDCNRIAASLESAP